MGLKLATGLPNFHWLQVWCVCLNSMFCGGLCRPPSLPDTHSEARWVSGSGRPSYWQAAHAPPCSSCSLSPDLLGRENPASLVVELALQWPGVVLGPVVFGVSWAWCSGTENPDAVRLFGPNPGLLGMGHPRSTHDKIQVQGAGGRSRLAQYSLRCGCCVADVRGGSSLPRPELSPS